MIRPSTCPLTRSFSKLQTVPGQLISGIYLGKRRAPSVSPTVRPAKQPPCLYTRHQFQHCMPLRYVGGDRWIVLADAICPRAQSMQRSVGGLQIPRLVGVGSERKVIFIREDEESFSPFRLFFTLHRE